jgi:hypothetical protein
MFVKNIYKNLSKLINGGGVMRRVQLKYIYSSLPMMKLRKISNWSVFITLIKNSI